MTSSIIHLAEAFNLNEDGTLKGSSGTARRSACTASHAAPANTAQAAAKPPTAMAPSFGSCATTISSAA